MPMPVSVSYRPIAAVFLFLILPWLTGLSISPVHAEPSVAPPAKERTAAADSSRKTIFYQMFGRKEYVHGEPMTEIVDTYTYAAILDFGLTEHSSFILRYGVASYGIDQDALNRTIATAERIGIHLPPLNLSDTVRIHVGTLGYKYRFNPSSKVNPFVEMGIGLSNPIPTLDTGTKLTASAALGFQYTLGNVWSLYIESRALAWKQRDVLEAWDILDAGKTVTTASNEFSLGLGKVLK